MPLATRRPSFDNTSAASPMRRLSSSGKGTEKVFFSLSSPSEDTKTEDVLGESLVLGLARLDSHREESPPPEQPSSIAMRPGP